MIRTGFCTSRGVNAATTSFRNSAAFPTVIAPPSAALRAPPAHYDTLRTARIVASSMDDHVPPLPVHTPTADTPAATPSITLSNARALLSTPSKDSDSKERRYARAQANILVQLAGGPQNRVRDARTGEFIVVPPTHISFLLTFQAHNCPRDEAAFYTLLGNIASAHHVTRPKLVAVADFMPNALLVVGYNDEMFMSKQFLGGLNEMIGEFGLYSEDLIKRAETITHVAGRRFDSDSLVASLRASQKVAFDIAAVKKTRPRGVRSAPTREAVIDVSFSVLIHERIAFSAAISQLIAGVAALLNPFQDGRPVHSIVACFYDICPTNVAKHLEGLRIKHLTETESIHAAIRAATAANTRKDSD